MPTADKLITVAENVPKVYHAGQLNVIENTSTLKKSASGSAILVDDVSPVTHDMGVKVRGKNLIPYPFTYATLESYGITFTDNKDGTITLNGQNNGSEISNYNLFQSADKLSFLKPNTDYYLSCNLDNITRSLRTVKSDGTYKYYSYGNVNFSSDETPDRLFIQIKKTDTTTYDNTIVKLQIELGTTATDYTPYVPDLTAVKVSRCGKNLFDKSIPYEDYKNIGNGYSCLSIYVGSSSTVTVSLLQKYNLGLGGYFYCADCKCTSSPPSSHQKWLYANSNTGLCAKSVTVISEDGYISLLITSEAYNVFKDEIMVEIGSNATEYEPYIIPTEYTPTADGTVNGVTSLYPNTTLTTDTYGVLIDCEYYRDIDADEVVTRTMTSYSNPKIKVVGNSAFQSCPALTTVNFPVATSIGNSAFSSCPALTTVNFPVATSIGNSAFSSCSALTTVNFPVATSIGNSAFSSCSALTTVDFPVATSIGDNALNSCSKLTTVNFPVATSIGAGVFIACSALTTVDFPSITNMGDSVFYNCSALTTVNFPVATNIGNYAFRNCSALTTVNFPVATSIGNYAFYNCTALSTVDFPVATNIGQYAFRNCSALTRIILRNNSICSLSSTTAFIGCTHISGNDGFIYVPSILIDEYKTATNWVTYASKFRALEDYTVDGTTTGALDESKVSA